MIVGYSHDYNSKTETFGLVAEEKQDVWLLKVLSEKLGIAVEFDESFKNHRLNIKQDADKSKFTETDETGQ